MSNTINPAKSLLGRPFTDFGVASGLSWHLRSNHYPPIHPDFDPAVRAAIRLGRQAIGAQHVGDHDESNLLWDTQVKLPNGTTPTVRSIVEQCHLDHYLNQQYEEETV